GMYYIQFEVTDDLMATLPDVGSDDTIDSDVTEIMGPFTTSLFIVPDAGDDHIDLGLIETGEVDGLVWTDDNGDGVRQGNEDGVNGIQVELYNTSNELIGTTVTSTLDGNVGAYRFENILAGDYYVFFDVPQGQMATLPNAGSDETVDSDVTGDNGINTTSTFVINSEGQENINLGLISSSGGMINGTVWEDYDGDGMRESSEDVISGLEVRLKDAVGNLIETTTTAGNGTYMFMDLPDGDYYVEFDIINNELPTLSNAVDDTVDSDVTETNGLGTTDTYTISGGLPIPNVGYGYYFPLSIGDKVWRDINGNGLFDGGEPGVNNIVVRLFKDGGEEVASTTTSIQIGQAGTYIFDNVVPGNYYLKFEIPDNAGFTAANAGSNSSDSDVTNANGEGTTDLFELFSGEDEFSFDAGLIFGEGAIGDFVWLDVDGDGLQGVSESGFNGVSLSLFKDDGSLVSTTQSTTSDLGQDGYYQFSGLEAGDYYIVVNLPDTLIITDADQGDDTIDSDITSGIVSGSTDLISVSNTDITNVDIGVLVPATIGDFVWEDINKNGIQDDGEPGVKDVEVILFTSTGIEVGFAFTDIQGMYEIGGLKPGLYFAEFLLPSGDFAFTLPNEGMDDTIDSDTDQTGVTSIFTLDHAQEFNDLDAGIFLSNPLIGGIVWMDDNKDGIRNENHLLNNVTVLLLDEDEQIIDVTHTNFAGRYAFNVPAGRYYIEVSPDNQVFEFTQPNTGVNGGEDSDVGVDGRSALIKVDPGNDPIKIDAGIIIGENAREEERLITPPAIARIDMSATPNLTWGPSTLKLTNVEGEIILKVFDRGGLLIDVIKGTYNNGIDIDLSNYKQGSYYIMAVTARGTATTMIVKI
ncbi:MAG: hypothetical protein HKN68_03615, partial [Saprospiraceae bacterium]|nr:hypothetical protein [Saprospiraceae bacterium]